MWRPPKIPFSPGQALFQSQHASVESATQSKAYSFNWQTSNGSLFSPSQPPSLQSAVASEEGPLTCNDMIVHMHGAHRGDRQLGTNKACSPQFSQPMIVDFSVTINLGGSLVELIQLWGRCSGASGVLKYPWWVEMYLNPSKGLYSAHSVQAKVTSYCHNLFYLPSFKNCNPLVATQVSGLWWS